MSSPPPPPPPPPPQLLDTRGLVTLAADHVAIRGVGADHQDGDIQSPVHVHPVGTGDSRGLLTVVALAPGSEWTEGPAPFPKKGVITLAKITRRQTRALRQDPGPSRPRKRTPEKTSIRGNLLPHLHARKSRVPQSHIHLGVKKKEKATKMW